MRRGFTVDEAGVVVEYVRVPTRIRTTVSVCVVAGQTAYPQLASLAAGRATNFNPITAQQNSRSSKGYSVGVNWLRS
jgi:hypothetical protein